MQGLTIKVTDDIEAGLQSVKEGLRCMSAGWEPKAAISIMN